MVVILIRPARDEYFKRFPGKWHYNQNNEVYQDNLDISTTVNIL